MASLRRRRMAVGVVLITASLVLIIVNGHELQTQQKPQHQTQDSDTIILARDGLEELDVKGRAPKTGYTRAQFGDGWSEIAGCDTRNLILYRDLVDTVVDIACVVESGVLIDPYTEKKILFERGLETSQLIQIDHVVALSDAWQKGAQQLSYTQRVEFANDPLELLAVDGQANSDKSDGDAATWLPPNKAFRCQYVARQIAVKFKYQLWVTTAERSAMIRVLNSCPNQSLPVAKQDERVI